MNQDSTYTHIRELFDEKLKPIVNNINDLRQELKDMNYTALTLKVESLEKSKEYYKLEYFNTVKRVDMLEHRINKIDNTVEEVNKLDGIEKGLLRLTNKVEELETTLEKHELIEGGNLVNIKTDVVKLKEDLFLFILMKKYPKMTLAIVIALIALLTSDKIAMLVTLLKQLF
jgi:hypothetical protein